jgi:hypothetical protein
MLLYLHFLTREESFYYGRHTKAKIINFTLLIIVKDTNIKDCVSHLLKTKNHL